MNDIDQLPCFAMLELVAGVHICQNVHLFLSAFPFACQQFVAGVHFCHELYKRSHPLCACLSLIVDSLVTTDSPFADG